MAKDLVLCGKVAKPHGLKGELSIDLFAHSPFFLDNFKVVYLKPPLKEKYYRFKIISWRPHQQRVLLLVENIEDRTRAEEFRGSEVYFAARDFPPKEEGEFYLFELRGWQVYLSPGEFLGTINDIQLIGENEIWEIKTPQGKEILFPAQEEFIVQMLAEEKKAVIDPPEGLLDIYLNE
ncbi:MAG: Ribosome maturation factor RimM [Desulfonauticus sp. 38_4375]|nr:MAG: Ribosome maturation factor RimM [Desulfonauticus sp. 38_4375]